MKRVSPYVTMQPLMGLLSWYPAISSNFWNSFEEQVPVDEIYRCLIQITLDQQGGTRVEVPVMANRGDNHTLLI